MEKRTKSEVTGSLADLFGRVFGDVQNEIYLVIGEGPPKIYHDRVTPGAFSEDVAVYSADQIKFIFEMPEEVEEFDGVD